MKCAKRRLRRKVAAAAQWRSNSIRAPIFFTNSMRFTFEIVIDALLQHQFCDYFLHSPGRGIGGSQQSASDSLQGRFRSSSLSTRMDDSFLFDKLLPKDTGLFGLTTQGRTLRPCSWHEQRHGCERELPAVSPQQQRIHSWLGHLGSYAGRHLESATSSRPSGCDHGVCG